MLSLRKSKRGIHSGFPFLAVGRLQRGRREATLRKDSRTLRRCQRRVCSRKRIIWVGGLLCKRGRFLERTVFNISSGTSATAAIQYAIWSEVASVGLRDDRFKGRNKSSFLDYCRIIIHFSKMGFEALFFVFLICLHCITGRLIDVFKHFSKLWQPWLYRSHKLDRNISEMLMKFNLNSKVTRIIVTYMVNDCNFSPLW